MRGDTSDNIFSAYPGVRTKGSKNKIGLTEAFEDRVAKGFNWNNLMQQRWVDHDGVEHKVFDDYNRNRLLCDLTLQPDNVKEFIKETIENVKIKEKNVGMVGVKLMKFCASYGLLKIAEQSQNYVDPLNARYIV
jgi:hypothetical protein